MPRIVIFLFSLIYQSGVHGQQAYTLLPLELNGRDSFLNCEMIKQYKQMERYMKNFMDRSLDQEIRLSSKNSLYRLFFNEKKPFDEAVIMDSSLDTTFNSLSYKSTAYINKVNELVTMFKQYKKYYIYHGCPQQASVATNDRENISGTEEIVFYPILHLSLEYVDSSFVEVVNKTLFKERYTNYVAVATSKKLYGTWQKVIISEDFTGDVKKSYIRLRKEHEQLGKKEIRDSTSVESMRILERRKIVLDSLITLEQSFTEFQYHVERIEEFRNVKIKDKLKLLAKEEQKCDCGYPPSIDEDGDGYIELVDCNDKDSTVYPGAPRNPYNNWDDDNCDGQPDNTERICNNYDGDDFMEGPDCECIKDLKSKDIQNKCDCNDQDATVYPGAPFNPDNNWDDDNCDGINDCLTLARVNPVVITPADRIYPPLGLIKFGIKAKSTTRAKIYTGSMIITSGMAAYFKITSQKYYQDYLQNTTLRRQDVLYDKANLYHRAFLVSTASTLLVYGVTHLDLTIKHKKYLYDRKKTIEDLKKSGCASVYPILRLSPFSVDAMTVGPTLTLSF